MVCRGWPASGFSHVASNIRVAGELEEIARITFVRPFIVQNARLGQGYTEISFQHVA
jgi:hypothetical protein